MTVFKTLTTLSVCAAAALTLAACKPANTAQAPAVDTAALGQILDVQTDKSKARYVYRNPAETIAFFGLTRGMKVAEALPGGNWDGSWYTRILAPYLGKDGHITGVDYAPEMWPLFGGFATPEFIKAKETWPAQWTGSVSDAGGDAGPAVSAFTFSTVPSGDKGSYDAVLFIRALHNMSRFEDAGGYMSTAITTAHDLLKPGGIVGVVQHRAPESASDDWANGQNGYIKQSAVIAAFEAAGFKLAGSSDINANAKDMPQEGDFVWRLPPSLSGSKEDPAKRAQMQAIGESDRMTLKFVKK